MQWVSELSTAPSFVDALSEAAAGVSARLGGSAPTIVFAFASPHHREHFAALPSAVAETLDTATVFGCGAAGIIGGARELERSPALTLVGAVMPSVELRPFHVDTRGLPATDAGAVEWHERIGIVPDDAETIVLLADPHTSHVMPLLAGLDRAYPNATKVGGLVSGSAPPVGAALFAGQRTYQEGTIGLAISGNVAVDTIVAQGCRPIGTPMFITRADANLAHELDGRSSARVLQETYEQASPRDRELMRGALFLGLAGAPDREVYGQGDFLVRNVLGLDARTGALAVGANLRTGAVVQFHVRDAETSAADLEQHLARYRERGVRPAGALMFSCVGRGVGLYGHPNHDTDELIDSIGRSPGELAVGGFFGNGEIGPVGRQTHLHGYTTVIALFRRVHSD
jgi:small ligand-binding sensory domain FIST